MGVYYKVESLRNRVGRLGLDLTDSRQEQLAVSYEDENETLGSTKYEEFVTEWLLAS